MKRILLLLSAVTLLTTAGCIFPGHRGGGEYRGHEGYRDHREYREHSEYRSAPEPGIDVRLHVP